MPEAGVEREACEFHLYKERQRPEGSISFVPILSRGQDPASEQAEERRQVRSDIVDRSRRRLQIKLHVCMNPPGRLGGSSYDHTLLHTSNGFLKIK